MEIFEKMKKSPIKILQIIHWLHLGGAEKVLVDIATKVDPSEFDITVCCIKEKGYLSSDLEEAGIDIVMPEKSYRIKYLNVLSLRKLIKSMNIDLVHSHSTPALLELGPIYMLGGMPPWVHTFHFGNYPNIPKRHLFLERIFSKFVTKCVAVADHQRNAIIKYHHVNPEKIITIENGVNKNPYLDNADIQQNYRHEFGIADGDIVIGTIAILTKQKGITYLLDAASELIKKYPNLKLLLVGGGALLDDLKEKANKLGLNERVIFAGWREDAIKIINIFDIFILPSLWEGLSISVLEAMADRRTIVVTNVGDNKRLIKNKESGMLITPEDSGAIVEAISYIVDEKKYNGEMAERAYREYNDNFTIEKMVGKYAATYKKLVD